MHVALPCSVAFLFFSATAADPQEQALTPDKDFIQKIERFEGALNYAFRDVGPLQAIITEISRTTGAGWGISFNVIWPSVDPVASKQLAAEIRAYDGKLQWLASEEFNHRG